MKGAGVSWVPEDPPGCEASYSLCCLYSKLTLDLGLSPRSDLTALLPRLDPTVETIETAITKANITAAVPTAAAVVPDSPIASPMKEREDMRLSMASTIPMMPDPPEPETLATLHLPPSP